MGIVCFAATIKSLFVFIVDMSFRSNLEVTTNIVIIVVALLIGFILVKKYVFPTTVPNQNISTLNQAAPKINIGTDIKIPDIDFVRFNKTLVLVVSSTCHFCSESASFYRRILSETNRNKLQIVAVLPQDTNTGKAYLQGLGVQLTEIKQMALSQVNVSGTPTLILLDSSGKVLDFWVGKLPPEKEEKVMATLKG